MPLLSIKNMSSTFHTGVGDVSAVRGISLHLDEGESIGIVGESGSGKSVSMLSVMGLTPKNCEVRADQILFDGKDLTNVQRRDMRKILGKDIAMIHFKDFLRKDAGGQLAATGAGQGGMEDYRTILRFAKQEKPYIFATLENTTPENAVECLNYLKKQYDEC